MKRFVLAAVALAATQAFGCANRTPWPRDPKPWPEQEKAALNVPNEESRAAFEQALATRVHALDMELVGYEAMTAQSRAALRCVQPDPAALLVLHEKRLALGAAQFDLATTQGDRWLDERGMLEAAIRDYEEGIDRVIETLPPGVAFVEPDPAARALCAAK